MAAMTRSPLISPHELTALTSSDPRLVILDARPSADDFARGHLRGAQHAALESQLSSARDPEANPVHGGRHPLPPLERWLLQLGQWGITPASEVVIYDDQNGANAAARAWWMLRAVGHEKVAVVDGGFAAAKTAGFEVTTDESQSVATTPYPATQWSLPTVDADQVDLLRRDDQWRVLDVRAAARFRGETEPIDPIAGHIPGAINLPFDFNQNEGRFRSPEELRETYRNLLGDVPAERLVVHCGSGVTACHTLLALESAGLTGASLYVGSWSEWCRNDRPRATQ
jgi:thiosulfate/3-mercaptopyruvate sulfurtransferase